MQTYKAHINKKIIIEITLALVEENGGIKNVTLRDIGKRAGCAHTNLYNYFTSIDEIFWEALGEVIIRMMDNAGSNICIEKGPEENFYLVLSNIIDFSLDHPGWYKLLWLETLSGDPPKRISNLLQKPGEGFTNGIIIASNNTLTQEKAILIGDILHSYLHGELCKWINHRSFINTREETKANILLNLKHLFKLFLEEEEDTITKINI